MIRFLMLSLGILPLSLFSQSKNSPNNLNKRRIKSDSDLLHTVTWLMCSTDTSSIRGTGFFFIYNEEVYIITNKHIIEGCNSCAYTLEIEDSKKIFPIIPILDKTKTFDFVSPNRDIAKDVAAIKISDITGLELESHPNWKAFDTTNFTSQKEVENIKLFTDKIVSLSFPDGYFYPPPKSPIIFNCGFASNFLKNIQQRENFYINGDLVEGCSGSPLILPAPHNRYLLIGIYFYSIQAHRKIDSVEYKRIPPDVWLFPESYPKKTGKQINNMEVFISGHLGIANDFKVILELLKK